MSMANSVVDAIGSEIFASDAFDEDSQMYDVVDELSKIVPSSKQSEKGREKWRKYFTVALLALINMLNYMDRFTIPGVLPLVTESFNLSQAEGGLLQTVFIVAYMIFAPLFGFLGDRYSRKWLIVVGITIWSLVSFLSSFVPDSAFWLFLVARGLVGIGESSYITVSPSIVGDLFTGEQRFTMLTSISATVAIGSGLGYLIGAQLAVIFGDWRYALRFTPILGIICVLLVIFVMREPVRGLAELEELANSQLQSSRPSASASQFSTMTKVKNESSAHASKDSTPESTASSTFKARMHRVATSTNKWLHEILGIIRIPTFALNTAGFTAVTFATGSLSWWAPTYLYYAFGTATAANVFPSDQGYISFTFGLLTCIAGFLGVALGMLAARFLRPIFGMRADPYACAAGLMLAGPTVYLCLIISPYSDIGSYTMIFISEIGLCLNWALTTDIMLRVVVPARRSSANALIMLVAHLFGDALCPLLIGAIADSLAPSMCAQIGTTCSADDPKTIPNAVYCVALMYALFVNSFICVLGGGGYLFCSFTIERDAKKKDERIAAAQQRVAVMQEANGIASHNQLPLTDFGS